MKKYIVFFVMMLMISSAAALDIIITSPEDGENYGIQPVPLIVVTEPAADLCWWTVDDGITNTTFTSYFTSITNLSFSTKYTLTVFCNDSLNNIGFDTTVFEFKSSRFSSYQLSFIFLMIFIIWIVLIFIGIKSDNPFWFFLAGIIFLLLGVYIVIYGFLGIANDLLEKGLGVIITGIGMYIVVAASLSWIKLEDEE